MSANLASDNKAVSLSCRKDIKAYEPEKDKLLKKIEDVTGVSGWTWDFEGDLNAFNNAIDAGYKDRLGEILIGKYLGEVCDLFTRECKDDMVKEALLESIGGSKKLRFTPYAEKPKSTSEYQRVAIKDGVFTVGCHPENLWGNINIISNTKLESLL